MKISSIWKRCLARLALDEQGQKANGRANNSQAREYAIYFD